MKSISLGLGLLSIGRQWGVRNVSPPPPAQSVALINAAAEQGIRFFDTAPAYGGSEKLLGQAIDAEPSKFAAAMIATKAGEHWIDDTRATYVDHSYDAMCRSIDRSLEYLGRITLLQIHKTSTDVLARADLPAVIRYAESCGIKEFGASVADVETARVALDSGKFGWLQFPFNGSSTAFKDIFPVLHDQQVNAIINRPFAMGKIAQSGDQARKAAFGFILEAGLPPDSVILTGTSSEVHLSENISCFEYAQHELAGGQKTSSGNHERSD